MPTYYLDSQIRKAILSIEDKVTDMSNILRDISMKFCHLIKERRDYDDVYNDMIRGTNYYEE